METNKGSTSNKTFDVVKFKNREPNSGKASRDVPWELSNILTAFSYPWEDGPSPPMEFKAMHDGKWFYCSFRVIDTDVKVYRVDDRKQEVIHGDRVEIFFAQDESLAEYYCLEMDRHARVYDYRAAFHRKFDDDWNWPSDDISVMATFSDSGYEVMLSIRLQSLENFGVLRNGKMLTGIFRGKCTEVDLKRDTMRWISWMEPQSDLPDFHIPSSFGELHLL